jgi:hypothetical protein
MDRKLNDTIKHFSTGEQGQRNNSYCGANIDIPYEHQFLVLERVKNARLNPEQLLPWADALKVLNS